MAARWGNQERNTTLNTRRWLQQHPLQTDGTGARSGGAPRALRQRLSMLATQEKRCEQAHCTSVWGTCAAPCSPGHLASFPFSSEMICCCRCPFYAPMILLQHWAARKVSRNMNLADNLEKHIPQFKKSLEREFPDSPEKCPYFPKVSVR